MIPLGPVVARAKMRATRATVWACLVRPEHRASWWSELQLEPVLGGAISERWAEGEGDARVSRDAAGAVDVIVPEHALGFRWKEAGDPRTTAVLITLRTLKTGTAVTVTETGFDALAEAPVRAAASQEGWNVLLRDFALVAESTAEVPPMSAASAGLTATTAVTSSGAPAQSSELAAAAAGSQAAVSSDPQNLSAPDTADTGEIPTVVVETVVPAFGAAGDAEGAVAAEVAEPASAEEAAPAAVGSDDVEAVADVGSDSVTETAVDAEVATAAEVGAGAGADSAPADIVPAEEPPALDIDEFVRAEASYQAPAGSTATLETASAEGSEPVPTDELGAEAAADVAVLGTDEAGINGGAAAHSEPTANTAEMASGEAAPHAAATAEDDADTRVLSEFDPALAATSVLPVAEAPDTVPHSGSNNQTPTSEAGADTTGGTTANTGATDDASNESDDESDDDEFTSGDPDFDALLRGL